MEPLVGMNTYTLTDMDQLFSTPISPIQEPQVAFLDGPDTNGFLSGDFLNQHMGQLVENFVQTADEKKDTTTQDHLLFGDDFLNLLDYSETTQPLTQTEDLPQTQKCDGFLEDGLLPLPDLSTPSTPIPQPYIAPVVQPGSKRKGPKMLGKRKYLQDDDNELNQICKKSKMFNVQLVSQVEVPPAPDVIEELRQPKRKVGRPPKGAEKTEKKGKILMLCLKFRMIY